MSVYGLELYDENGGRTLSVTDRVGRFLGIFTVPSVPTRSSRTFKFEVPAHHLEFGELFFWYNPVYDTAWHWNPNLIKHYDPEVTIDINLSFNILTVNINVGWSPFSSGELGEFQIFYGVR